MTALSLKAARDKKGLSQFALAMKSDVSRYKISQFECGYGKLTKEEKQKIKGVLSVTSKKST